MTVKVLILWSSISTDAKTRRLEDLMISKKCIIEMVDGADLDPVVIKRRNDLFVISGLRAKYPQCFINNNGTFEFIGLWETIESLEENESLPEHIKIQYPEIKTFSSIFFQDRHQQNLTDRENMRLEALRKKEHDAEVAKKILLIEEGMRLAANIEKKKLDDIASKKAEREAERVAIEAENRARQLLEAEAIRIGMCVTQEKHENHLMENEESHQRTVMEIEKKRIADKEEIRKNLIVLQLQKDQKEREHLEAIAQAIQLQEHEENISFYFKNQQEKEERESNKEKLQDSEENGEINEIKEAEINQVEINEQVCMIPIIDSSPFSSTITTIESASVLEQSESINQNRINTNENIENNKNNSENKANNENIENSKNEGENIEKLRIESNDLRLRSIAQERLKREVARTKSIEDEKNITDKHNEMIRLENIQLKISEENEDGNIIIKDGIKLEIGIKAQELAELSEENFCIKNNEIIRENELEKNHDVDILIAKIQNEKLQEMEKRNTENKNGNEKKEIDNKKSERIKESKEIIENFNIYNIQDNNDHNNNTNIDTNNNNTIDDNNHKKIYIHNNSNHNRIHNSHNNTKSNDNNDNDNNDTDNNDTHSKDSSNYENEELEEDDDDDPIDPKLLTLAPLNLSTKSQTTQTCHTSPISHVSPIGNIDIVPSIPQDQ